LIVYTTLLIPGAIVAEATLSFLGLSVVAPSPSWGNILSDAMAYYRLAWWFVFFPGGALLVSTLAFNVPRLARAASISAAKGAWSK
jgi:peptide/nickel transport system permease protein